MKFLELTEVLWTKTLKRQWEEIHTFYLNPNKIEFFRENRGVVIIETAKNIYYVKESITKIKTALANC